MEIVSYKEVFRMKKKVLLIVIALASTLAGWFFPLSGLSTG